MGRSITETKPRERRRRRDGNMGEFNNRLAMPAGVAKNPGYTYRWVNDDGTRLAKAIANDYDFTDETGDEVDARSTNRHSVHVGTKPSGEPLLAYLMRKRVDWYRSDKAAEQTAIDESMKSIQREAETSRAKPTGLNVKVS